MKDIFFFVILNLVGVILLVYYLDTLFSRKNTVFFYAGTFLAGGLIFGVNIGFKNTALNLLAAFCITLLYAYIFYAGNKIIKIAFIILYITIGVIVEDITYLANTILKIDPVRSYYFWGILSLIINVLIVLFIGRSLKTIKSIRDNRIMLFVLGSSLFALFYMVIINSFITNKEARLIALVTELILLMVAVFIYKYLEQKSIKEEVQREKERLELVIEATTNYYSMVDSYQKEISRMKHDMKNQLLALYYLEEHEKMAYLKKMLNEIDITGKQIYSKNPLINYILHQKINGLEIEDENIMIRCSFPQEQLSSIIESGDLGVLLGNLLDNVLEALEKQPLQERFFHLNIKQEGIFFIIEAVNSCLKKEEPFITDKNDKRFHGYGIKSIKDIAEKYNGSYRITVDDKRFKNDIQIPIITTLE